MVAALTACGEKNVSDEKVEITEYKGIEIEKVEPTEVTEEAINSDIEYTLQTVALEHGIKDRAAVSGDTVIIDYVGKKDGVAFEGGTASDYALELGSGTFIPGFEDAIIGHKPGETFDINVTFPEEYQSEELAGQPVVFTITFDAIVPTELTDTLATAIVGSETTVEEYKQMVKESLTENNKQTAQSEFENKVWTEVVSNCTVKNYDKDELESWKKIMEETYGYYASMYNMETEEYLSTYYKTSVEELAKEQLRWKYAAELIAKNENLTLSLEEYDKQLGEIATAYGYEDSAEYEKGYEEMYGEGSLKDMFLQQKVMKWLVDNAVEVEATKK